VSEAAADGIRLDIDGVAAHLVLDRPDRRNAVTQAMWRAIPAYVAEAEATPGVRVIVVRSSTHGVFSAGADIGEYRDSIGDVEWGVANQERVSEGTAALRASALPVIAAVDGPAFGAGAGLVVSCDLRVATLSSTFAITPAKLGMVYPFPDVVALVDVVGAATARRILLTGATFDAAQGLRVGLLDEVVSDAAALDAAVARLVDVLATNSRTSIALMKRTIALAAAGQRNDDDVTRGIVREALEGGDYAEGARAFLDRRPPTFP
jgi:enoyl-CoA hydratase/carnithine racemase